MPYDDPDAADPMTLRGVAVQTRDERATLEMAECFIEEYLRSGFDPDRVMQLFRTPAYAGPFMAYRTLGEDTLRTIIDEQVSRRGPHRPPTPAGRGADGRISLPVLES